MEESASALLANRRGGFAWLGTRPESRYQGLFFRIGGSVFKTVADIYVGEPLHSLTNMLWGVQRDYASVNQRLTMPYGRNALIVEFSSSASADILLDCKMIDDNREWGRNYEVVSQEKGCIVIKFQKRNDNRDDNSKCNVEYDLFVAIAGNNLGFVPLAKWVEQHYSFDEQRKSPPYSRWVYNAGTINAQRFVIAAARTKKEAVAEARRVLNSRMLLIHRQMKAVSAISQPRAPMPKKISLAYQCACNALDSLAVGDEGLYAGVPWFYQFWLRDEAVSCNALKLLGRKKLVKNILKRHVGSFAGRHLPYAFADYGLCAADGPGWVGLRYSQSRDLFSKREQSEAEKKLRNALNALKARMQNGLVMNGPLETWMDTSVDGKDVRDGARIEIQALTLALASALGENEFEKDLVQRVRDTFWDGSVLHDGLNDPTIRPNVFIAAYAYPELLSREQWEKCFDTVLPRLWLRWGGISSIDINHELFTDHYTGQDNVSYHRGDSWFWLNNLAALVLYRTNAAKYKHFIEQIVEASSHEILELGAIGHHAELSSARALSSHGCVSQAWSSAMFIELCNELF
ncbi:MAG: amylo-alpha-1,6-glucosidase [Candidatus Woesearchaeota archaeon]